MARRRFTIIFTILGFALFVSMAGFLLLYLAVGREPAVASNSTLVLKVGGDLAEVAPANVVGYLRGAKAATVRGIVDNLRKAKVDAASRRVLLKPTGFESPYWGKVQEIRDAVIDFKKSGKPVYAYLEYGGDREYYLASAADRIFLMPSSPLDLNGVATYQVFLRGTLDKIGAYPDLHHIGDYKTAVEPAHREGLHARPQGDGRVAQPRPVRSVRSRRRRRAQEERGGRRAAARRGSVPSGRRAARGPGRRCGLRGPGRGAAQGRAGPARRAGRATKARPTGGCARSTATTTHASARPRSG